MDDQPLNFVEEKSGAQPFSKLSDESEVKEVLERFAQAIRSGDLTDIMSFYSPEVIAFDMMPPLQFTSKDRYATEAWGKCFTDVFRFPVNYSFHQTHVKVAGDVAVCCGLTHMSGEFKSGEQVETWLRNTIVLAREMARTSSGDEFAAIGSGDHWLIVHEHNSVPVGNDMKAMMNLAPGELVQ